MLVQGAKKLQEVRPLSQEYDTRAQRKMFKNKMKNLSCKSPSVADFIYKELAMDASTSTHPLTQERL